MEFQKPVLDLRDGMNSHLRLLPGQEESCNPEAFLNTFVNSAYSMPENIPSVVFHKEMLR